MNAVGRCGPSGLRVTGCVAGEPRGGSGRVWELTPVGCARIASDMRGKLENVILTLAKVCFLTHTFKISIQPNVFKCRE